MIKIKEVIDALDYNDFIKSGKKKHRNYRCAVTPYTADDIDPHHKKDDPTDQPNDGAHQIYNDQSGFVPYDKSDGGNLAVNPSPQSTSSTSTDSSGGSSPSN